MQVFSTIRDKPHAYRFNETTNYLEFNPIEFSISDDGINWLSCYDEPELAGIYMYDKVIPVANVVDNVNRFGLQDGQTLLNTQYDQRDILCHFSVRNIDLNDKQLALKALERFVASRKPFWITFSDDPGKKYLVKTKTLVPNYAFTESLLVDVTFNNINGVAQSVGTSLDLESKADVPWAFGLNLDDNRTYTFKSGSFDVWNHGDIEIQPSIKLHPFKMHVKGAGKPVITNKTTGDVFQYNVDLGGKELILDRVNPLIGSEHVGINSNHGEINLAVGKNSFTVSGLTGSVSFEFPFLYL